jgi:hypothetical protein
MNRVRIHGCFIGFLSFFFFFAIFFIANKIELG